MLDVLINNARICDGTGSPIWRGSLGIEGDKIAYLGPATVAQAAVVIDAHGMVLAPGFIDPHTHYDAQLCWDRGLTSSSWHGVTTVVMGNCGVGVAPARTETRDMLLRDLENVEGIPFDVMKAAIPWEWEGYGAYLDFVDRRHLAINVAALVSVTALRHQVMGEESIQRAANGREIDEMCGVFREAVESGARGFSADYLADHIGYKGGPLACQLASEAELAALSRVLRAAGRGISSIAVNSMHSGTRLISDADVGLLRKIASDSDAYVTFLPVLAKAGEPSFHERTLEKLGDYVGRIVPQTSVQPFVFVQTLKKPFKFGYYQTFRRAMNRPLAEQLALYRSAEWRRDARDELDHHERMYPWDRTRVVSVANPELSSYVGRTLTEIASSGGIHPLEALADIACRDELETRFEVAKSNYDQDGIAWMLRRDEFLVGLSDGGAHVDQLCDSRYPSVLLRTWVRERGVLSLEQAVRKLTSVPAQLYGLTDRGVLANNKVADLVLFDPDQVDAEQPHLVADLPLGALRLISRARGVAAVFVAGKQILADGEFTGQYPGRVLR
jgi:N-acyl-D-amino-acid deacylase